LSFSFLDFGKKVVDSIPGWRCAREKDVPMGTYEEMGKGRIERTGYQWMNEVEDATIRNFANATQNCCPVSAERDSGSDAMPSLLFRLARC
jgi:hypothetical protein